MRTKLSSSKVKWPFEFLLGFLGDQEISAAVIDCLEKSDYSDAKQLFQDRELCLARNEFYFSA